MFSTGSQLITPPTEFPVTLDEAKLNLKVDETEDDTLIEDRLIPAATAFVEKFTSVRLLTQTRDYYYNDFPWEFKLPYAPISALTHIKYVNNNGDLTLVAASGYQADLFSPRARIKPVFTGVWPTVKPDTYNAVQVRVVEGFATPDDVPPTYKQAMHLLIAHWYANRETVVVGTISTELSLTLKSILSQERLYYFA